jgi:hypothetical protein
VTRVIEVPAHFDDRSFDAFAAGFGEWPPEMPIALPIECVVDDDALRDCRGGISG